MSHHLDSPIARQDIRLDITDLYVFRGDTGTIAANAPVSLGIGKESVTSKPSKTSPYVPPAN